MIGIGPDEVQALAKVIRACAAWHGVTADGAVDPSALYDLRAQRFNDATGMMAPGKDEPAALNSTWSDEERRQRWREWIAGEEIHLKRLLACAVVLLDGAEGMDADVEAILTNPAMR